MKWHKSYITSVSLAEQLSQLHVRTHPHRHSSTCQRKTPFLPYLRCSHKGTETEKNPLSHILHISTHTNTILTLSSIWVSCGKEHCSGLSHPQPPPPWRRMSSGSKGDMEAEHLRQYHCLRTKCPAIFCWDSFLYVCFDLPQTSAIYNFKESILRTQHVWGCY